MVGPTLIQNTTNNNNNNSRYTSVSTTQALQSKSLVLLYFSASWCPPCQSFSPLLKQFYAATHDEMEILYLSSDHNLAQFDEYFATMPWLSLATTGTAALKKALAQTLQIRGIPALVVLTRDGGLFVTDQAREQVTACMRHGGNPKQVVQQWKETTAVPVNEAKLNGGGGGSAGGLWGILTSLLKNPAAIFALIYFVKWAMRQHLILMSNPDEEANDAPNDVPMVEADEQDEF